MRLRPVSLGHSLQGTTFTVLPYSPLSTDICLTCLAVVGKGSMLCMCVKRKYVHFSSETLRELWMEEILLNTSTFTLGFIHSFGKEEDAPLPSGTSGYHHRNHSHCSAPCSSLLHWKGNSKHHAYISACLTWPGAALLELELGEMCWQTV